MQISWKLVCNISITNVTHIPSSFLTVLSFFIIVIIIELTHSKTIPENTVEIEPQPVALDFKNLSQYSSWSK